MIERYSLPESATIGPFVYPIVENGDITYEAGVYGRIEYQPHRILLSPDSSECRQRAVLLYELLHGVFDYLGLSDRIDEDHEERIITSLAPALLDTLRRNRDLVDFLLRD